MTQPISFEFIDQITLRDPKATRELLRVYVAQNKQNSRDLREAVSAQDWALARKIAHKLKSSLALVGLTEGRSKAELLERTAGDDVQETLHLAETVSSITDGAVHEVARKLKEFES